MKVRFTIRKKIVIASSIILILLSTTLAVGRRSVARAKEAVLRQDLKTMRDQIDNYTMDKEKAPQSLQDLVDGGYLRIIPKDPFTGSPGTWQIEVSDAMVSPNQTEPGISDVYSGSELTSGDGTAYNTW